MYATDVQALIRKAETQGVSLWMDGSHLRFKSERGKLTDDLRAALQSRRDELIGELSVPVFHKDAESPRLTKFPECSKGFWEECEANTSLRHGTHFAIKLSGAIDLARIESAFGLICSRHDLLRSTVAVAEDGVPFLQLDMNPQVPVEFVDLTSIGHNISQSEVDLAVERAIFEPFTNGHIFRARIIKVGELQYAIAFVIHHYVADVMSIEVLVRELLTSLITDDPAVSQKSERPLQYSEYLRGKNEWFAGPGLRYRLALWKERMRGAAAVRFPMAEKVNAAGPHGLDIIDLKLGEKMRAKLARAIALAKVPVPIAILAAHFAALAAIFRRQDFYSVMLHFGRDEPVLFDMVGFTVNCIPVRVTVSPDMTYIDLMTNVYSAFAFARDYQIPWGMLMPVLPEIGASHVAPLFNYLYAAEKIADERKSSSTSEIAPRFALEPITVKGPEPTNSVDWKSYELHAFDSGTAMRLSIKYMPSVYQSAAVNAYADQLVTCLSALAENAEVRVMAAPRRSEPLGHYANSADASQTCQHLHERTL